MKTFEELLNLQERGRDVVQGWLREATNPIEGLPPVEANRKSALVAWRGPRGGIRPAFTTLQSKVVNAARDPCRSDPCRLRLPHPN